MRHPYAPRSIAPSAYARDLLAAVERDRLMRQRVTVTVIICSAALGMLAAYAASLLYADALNSIRHVFGSAILH